MGPPTPLFPINLDMDSSDENTITSNNFSHNSNISNGTSNTSFVEVIIKNHHRKSKILHESPQVRKPSCSSVLTQTENVIKNDNEKDVIDEEEQPKVISNQQCDELNDETEDKDITTQDGYHWKLPVLPQRYFKIKTSSINKKNGVVIDIMPDKHNLSKGQMDRSHSQNPIELKKSEKKMVLQDFDDVLKPRNKEKHKGKTELYYFDRGNFSFYNTTDYPPIIMADHLAEKTEVTAIRFWAETFGMTNIVLAFVTTFILQLIRFILFGIVRPMTAGVVQLTSDYFLKPLLASIFNGIIQPPMIFLFNIVSSIRDVCEPIAQALGFFLKEFAIVIKSFRFVEIKKSEQAAV